MAVSIVASVLTGTDPRRVQVVVSGVDDGIEFTVAGTTSDGSSWSVPGGVGVSSGTQVVLIDARSALNVPVTYRVTVGDEVYVAPPVTVTYTSDFVVQDLRGNVVIPFEWVDNGDPREPEAAIQLTKIPGRRKKVGRTDIGSDGGGSWQILTTAENTKKLHELVVASAPVVMRSNGQIRDIAAVELVLILRAPNLLFAGDGGVSTRRVWSLSYELQDDPEPYTALIVITVDDLVAFYDTVTVDDVVSDFAGLTVDDFAAFDWKSVRDA